MKLVYLESPYAGEVERNVRYARRAMADSLARGEAPFLSHLLYTQALDDLKPEERKQGMNAGFDWAKKSELSVFYVDYGMSNGMVRGALVAQADGRPIEFRSIGQNPQ